MRTRHTPRALLRNRCPRVSCRRWWAVLAAAVVVLVVAPQTGHAANPPYYNVPPEFPAIYTAVVHEYPTPDSNALLGEIARGSDGNVWFLEYFSNTVDRVTPTGQLTRFPADFYRDLTTGPDGNLWLSGAYGKVTKMTTSGVTTDYPLPAGMGLGQITSGPGGRLWATGADSSGPAIVSIDPATGATQAFPLSGNAYPRDIAAGPDGNLWFTTVNAGGIGRMTPAGVATSFPVPGGKGTYETDGVTAGPDGNVWFTDGNDNLVGKVTPAGTMTVYPAPLTSSFPYNITAGPDGNVWFTGYLSNVIGRITPAGVFTMVHIPTPIAGPYDITTGGDGKLWFTEQSQVLNQVASLDPNTLMPPPPPCLKITHTTVLTHDVGPCAGDGIVIAASNVTLRLNGHRVFAAAGQRYGDFAGIHLLGVSGVTIDGQNPGSPQTAGSEVTGFDAGVFVDFGGNNTITKLNVHDNISPLDPGVNLGDGILLVHSAGNVVAGNRVVHNGIFDNIANLGLGGNNNRIQGNDVEQAFDPTLVRRWASASSVTPTWSSRTRAGADRTRATRSCATRCCTMRGRGSRPSVTSTA